MVIASLKGCVLECKEYLTPHAELGVRRNGGDSETCECFEGGVGFKNSNSLTRLNVSANARSPLSFESDVKQ